MSDSRRPSEQYRQSNPNDLRRMSEQQKYTNTAAATNNNDGSARRGSEQQKTTNTAGGTYNNDSRRGSEQGRQTNMTQSPRGTEMTSLSSLTSISSASVVTLPVLTAPRLYDASAETFATAIITSTNTNGSLLYTPVGNVNSSSSGSSNSISNNASNSNNSSKGSPKGNVRGESEDVICRYCGQIGPVKSEYCFSEKGQRHNFYFRGEKRDDQKDKRRIRWCWRLLLGVVLLVCYGISVAYVIIPIQKYLNQDVATSVTVLSATKDKPIPFPGIQICAFDWAHNITEFQVYFFNATGSAAMGFAVTTMNDYGYDDFLCFEVANFERTKRTMISSKREMVVIVATVYPSNGVAAKNSDCGPELCNPDLDENATIRDINPNLDAQGISVGAFPANGTARDRVEDDIIFLSAGAYSQVSLYYSRTYRYGQDVPEEGYSMRTSSIRYAPGTYAVNYFADDSFQMNQVVFAEISFGELSFTEVNETKSYEAFNAFADATAILGFFTGFGIFGGPTLLSLVMDNARNPCWSGLFYS